jgi:hypothetical protein
MFHVGITDDSARRKQEHGSPRGRLAFPTDSEATARLVESRFLALGMQGGRGSFGSVRYVYVF